MKDSLCLSPDPLSSRIVPSGGATLAGADGEADGVGEGDGPGVSVTDADGGTLDGAGALRGTAPSHEPIAQPSTTAPASPTWNRTELIGTSLIPPTRD
jgi:hypothetical protein